MHAQNRFLLEMFRYFFKILHLFDEFYIINNINHIKLIMNTLIVQEVINLIKEGQTLRQIASKVQLSLSSVQRIRKKYCADVPMSKGGRPHKINARDCRHLGNLVTSNADMTPKQALVVLKIDASVHTARRSLRRIGMESRVMKKKPLLTKNHIMQRRLFYHTHENWTQDDWNMVIWSDETKINRFQSDGRIWYWTTDPNEPNPNHVIQTVKHGGGSIMVWGCITQWGVGPLVKIDGIMRKEQYLAILQRNLPAVVSKMGIAAEKVIFQQDNDPKHKSKVVTKWLQSQKFSTMTWPPQSPDLNPIENLWSHVKSQLAKYPSPPKGMNELWDRTRDVWDGISPEFVSKYTSSMPSRLLDLKKK